MNGTIKITAKGSEVTVKGCLSNATLADQVALVDALMNTFGMTGVLREAICEALVEVSKEKQEGGVNLQ